MGQRVEEEERREKSGDRKREMKSEGARRPNEKADTQTERERQIHRPTSRGERHVDVLGVSWPSGRATTCGCETHMALWPWAPRTLKPCSHNRVWLSRQRPPA